MELSLELRQILSVSFSDAKIAHHEFFTPEHVLRSALAFTSVRSVIELCGADVAAIRTHVNEYIKKNVPIAVTQLDARRVAEPIETQGFQEVMNRAVYHCAACDKPILDITDVLVSMMEETRSYCAYSLRMGGVDKLQLLEAISIKRNMYIDEYDVNGEGKDIESDKELFEQDEIPQDDAQKKFVPGMQPTDERHNTDGAKSVKKTALEKFCVELVAEAQSGSLDALIGREDELERTVQILCRRTKNNPLYVGDAGVGKTAIANGLALRIADGNVPEMLQGFSIYSLDMGLVVAGTKYRGDFEDRLRKITDELMKKQNAILFIDEIHMIMGAGAGGNSTMDAANLLKPVLTSGKIRCIGSTTHEEYAKHFEKDRALARRFQKIDIAEPSSKDTLLILQGLRERYESYHGVVYSDDALKAAVDLAVQYVPDKRLPDKAIDIIDEAGAYCKITAKSRLNDVAHHEHDVRTSVDAHNAAGEQFDGTATAYAKVHADARSTTAHNARAHAEEYAGEQFNNSEFAQERPTVSTEIIKMVTAKMARVPLETVTNDEKDKLRELENTMCAEIFGQDAAVRLVSKAVKKARAGFNNPEKPEASFLFVGPTGVGKTELARSLSRILSEPLLRYDMSEYQEEYAISRLIGSAPGYVGYEEGGQLTEVVRKNPHAIVLFDEIEKAHQKIYNVLLQVMDYGFLTDNQGRKADFRNCIIIMTSNAGARDMEKGAIGFGADDLLGSDDWQSSSLREAVEKTFTPEFRNRLDAVVTFAHLGKDIVKSIAQKETGKLASRLAAKNVTLTVTPRALDYLAEKGYSREFGARNMARTVEEEIASPLTDEVLFGKLADGGNVTADVQSEQRQDACNTAGNHTSARNAAAVHTIGQHADDVFLSNANLHITFTYGTR